MATIWKRLFKKSDAISEAVERAIEAQVVFERGHPVPFDVPTRREALLARAALAYGAVLPAAGQDLVELAAADWKRAAKAAEETP